MSVEIDIIRWTIVMWLHGAFIGATFALDHSRRAHRAERLALEAQIDELTARIERAGL